jgi:periplasmic protein TonB
MPSLHTDINNCADMEGVCTAADWSFAASFRPETSGAHPYEFPYEPTVTTESCLSHDPWGEHIGQEWALRDGIEAPDESFLSYEPLTQLCRAVLTPEPASNLGLIAAVSSSLLVHAALLVVTCTIWVSTPGGHGDNLGPVIAVRLLTEVDVTPDTESPASRDATASEPAKSGGGEAENRTHRDESPQESWRNDDGRSSAPSDVSEPRKTDRHDAKINATLRAPNENGRDRTNSIESAPSLASAERRINRSGAGPGDRFKTLVLSAIHQAVFFPKKAFAERKHGQTVVSFTIRHDGSLSELTIRNGSGSEVLDDAALRIVRRASRKFPPIPVETHLETVSYEVPIIFTREGA